MAILHTGLGKFRFAYRFSLSSLSGKSNAIRIAPRRQGSSEQKHAEVVCKLETAPLVYESHPGHPRIYPIYKLCRRPSCPAAQPMWTAKVTLPTPFGWEANLLRARKYPDWSSLVTYQSPERTT